MFRDSAGFKAQYHGLTLVVAMDFHQWKILVRAPGVVIEGGYQPEKSAAERHACLIAENYVRQQKHQAFPSQMRLEWTPIEPGSWLTWRP